MRQHALTHCSRSMFSSFIAKYLLPVLLTCSLPASTLLAKNDLIALGKGSAADENITEGYLAQVYKDSSEAQLLHVPALIDLRGLENKASAKMLVNNDRLLKINAAQATFQITFLGAGEVSATGDVCETFPSTARTAFVAAANIWGSILQSDVPITVEACWTNLPGTQLGGAGPRYLIRDFENTPVTGTWYPAALANALVGSNLYPDYPDIIAVFDSDSPWYYGTDGNTLNNQYDLLSVVLHEFAHGLGFAGSAEYAMGLGSWGSQGYQVIYDNFVTDGSGNKVTNTNVYPKPSVALGTLLTSGDVWFNGSNAVSANNSNTVKLYAPPTWAAGSSYSHLDYDTFNNTSNQLMVYAISSGEAVHDPGPITKGLFKDLGWPIAGAETTPAKATLISPTGTITDTTPTYRWNAVAGATWYQLYVNDSSGNRINKWYTAAQAGCSSASTCSITPDTTLASGSGRWWVRTYNTAGNGPWSSAAGFTVNSNSVPAAATLISPTGSTADNTPTYTWNAVADSSWYYLWVNDSTGNKIKTWYTAASAGCANGTGTCSVTPNVGLSSGSANWWVQTWNNSGYGPWSSAAGFTVNGNSAPVAATLISPTGSTADNTPTYTWNAVADSSWYYLWVNDSTGNKIKTWYTAASAGCANGTGTCSVTPNVGLSSGSANWWVQTWNNSGYGPWSRATSFSVF